MDRKEYDIDPFLQGISQISALRLLGLRYAELALTVLGNRRLEFCLRQLQVVPRAAQYNSLFLGHLIGHILRLQSCRDLMLPV